MLSRWSAIRRQIEVQIAGYAVVFIFFFQAEDGIRDLTVTGVQTCALPIYIKRTNYLKRLCPFIRRTKPRWRHRDHHDYRLRAEYSAGRDGETSPGRAARHPRRSVGRHRRRVLSDYCFRPDREGAKWIRRDSD